MGAMSKRIPILVALFTVGSIISFAPRQAEACSCLPFSVSSSYQSATDVFIGRVMYEVEVGNTRWYIVRARMPLKGCIDKGQWVYVKTAASSAACGTWLEVGTHYLINGTAADSPWSVPVINIHSCSTQKPAASLTAAERAWLLGRYRCCGSECACVDGTQPVNCFADPCQFASCPSGECTANYCGGCNAEFYDSYNNLVCQPCASATDCGPAQVCTGGMCLSTCWSDEDCAEDAWCSPDQSGNASTCKPFQQEGESCGGFTPVWAQAKCAPGLICTDVPPFIADIPGTCRKPCETNKGCTAGQYCGLSGVCRDDGTCWDGGDCNLGGNDWPHIECVGYGVCNPDKTCGWECGTADQCTDLKGLDFGPCKMIVGYGVLGGSCSLIGGCSDLGYALFDSLTSCQATCDGPCQDLGDVDFGPCDALIGVGVVGGKCTWLSGCDSGDYELFGSLEACTKACNSIALP